MAYTRDLDKIGLKIGDEITLLELDDRIEKLIDNEEVETMLSSYDVSEILNWKKYVYFYNEDDEVPNRIYFEVLENTGDEHSRIKIISAE